MSKKSPAPKFVVGCEAETYVSASGAIEIVVPGAAGPSTDVSAARTSATPSA